MSTLVEDQKVVVKGINELRKQAGLGRINKLRRGIPLHPTACTLAMSAEGTGIAAGIQVGSLLYRQSYEAGEAAMRIITAFDKGELPELEIPKTPVKIKYPGDRKATVVG